MTPKFIIPYIDTAIYKKRKISHSINMWLRRWRFNPHKLQRVLINKLDPGNGIGDYIQCSALVTALKEASPNVEISFLVSGKEDLEVFELFPYLVSVINVHPSNINNSNLSEFAETKLYFKKFDLVIHGYGENAQFAKLISEQGNIQNSIGYFNKDEQGRFPFLTIHTPYNFKGVRPFSYDDQLSKVLDTTLDWKVNLDLDRLKNSDIDGNNERVNKILGLHPGCKSNRKETRWPANNFKDIALWFNNQIDGKILLFGGPDEEEEVRLLAEGFGNGKVQTILNKPILEVAILIQKCDVFVSNDSGLMNLSMALGVPSIGICGPTDLYSLQNIYPDAVFIGDKMPCCPCYNNSHYLICMESPDDPAKCLELIKPQEVIEKIEQMLAYDYTGSNVNRTSPQIRDTKPNWTKTS